MRKKIKIQYYDSPCGEMILGACEDRLCLCDWKDSKHRVSVDNRLQRLLNGLMVEAKDRVIDMACRELNEYFRGERRRFEIPMCFCGTDFQIAVWRGLMNIPYGKTISYGELAKNLNMPTSVRVVANATGMNAFAVMVPCHRVIGSDNRLTGYSGGLEKKQFLLDMELRNSEK